MRLLHLLLFVLLLSSSPWLALRVAEARPFLPYDDVSAVALSPDFGSDGTLFAIARGNLMRSRNGGLTWQRILNGIDHRHPLSALEIAPGDSQFVYLATLGDGIYRSDDGGDSWRRANGGLGGLRIARLAVSPRDPSTILAADDDRSLYRSGDAGETWQTVLAGRQVTALAFTSDGNGRVVAGDSRGGVHLSTDGGSNWQALHRLEEAVSAVAPSPGFAADRTLFVGSDRGAVYRSLDGGNTFAKLPTGFPTAPIVSIAVSPDYAWDSTVYAVSRKKGVYISRDGGQSWRSFGQGAPAIPQAGERGRPSYSKLLLAPGAEGRRFLLLAAYTGLYRARAEQPEWRKVPILPSGAIIGLGVYVSPQRRETLAVGTYLWGIYLSSDRGEGWQRISNGMEDVEQVRQFAGIARVRDVVFSPAYFHDSTLFSVTETHLLKSADAGRRWRKIRPLTGGEPNNADRFVLAVSPNYFADQTVFLGTAQGDLLRSTDAGESFSVEGIIGGPIVSLVVSPHYVADRTLFAGTADEIFRSRDGGITWQPVWEAGVPEGSGERSMRLAISPAYREDGTVFAGTGAGLLVTSDGGDQWRRLTGVPFDESAFVEAIALSPQFAWDRELMVSVRGRGLFRSRDGGATFREVGAELMAANRQFANLQGGSPPLSAMPLRYSPAYADDRTIYGYSGDRVFRSSDGGEHWRELPVPAPTDDYRAYARLVLQNIRMSDRLTLGLSSVVSFIAYLLLGTFRLRERSVLRTAYLRLSASTLVFFAVIALVRLA